jgi:predicted neuraminidase
MRFPVPVAAALLLLAAIPASRGDEPFCTIEPVFAAEDKHNHASCLVELPGGDLLVTWYRGTGERQADDVEIYAARRHAGAPTWGPRFLWTDTPGYPDCNPATFVDPEGGLWLWWPVILDHRWEGALLKFAFTRDAPDAGKPIHFDREGVTHVTPVGFDAAAQTALQSLGGQILRLDESLFQEIEKRSKDELYQRLGWMPRVHAVALPSGRWLLPLYSDTFSCSIVLRSDDRGQTWQTGAPMIGFGNIQPSLVRRNDGTIVAFMRDNGPFRRIRTAESKDEGATWGPVSSTDLPNPGAGIEAIRLASGAWLMVFNDTTAGRHSLALSLSDDEGRTWPVTRHLAYDPNRKERFHYPSLIQAADGSIHVSYTHGDQPNGSAIDHAHLNEAWIRAGDPADHPAHTPANPR